MEFQAHGKWISTGNAAQFRGDHIRGGSGMRTYKVRKECTISIMKPNLLLSSEVRIKYSEMGTQLHSSQQG